MALPGTQYSVGAVTLESVGMPPRPVGGPAGTNAGLPPMAPVKETNVPAVVSLTNDVAPDVPLLETAPPAPPGSGVMVMELPRAVANGMHEPGAPPPPPPELVGLVTAPVLTPGSPPAPPPPPP